MRIRIEAGANVRRWDTYELEVPDTFDPNSDDAEEYLHKRLDEDDAVEHIERRFEDDSDKYPAEDQGIISWRKV